MPDRKQLDLFIGSTFRSVWALDCLRHLAANPDTYHPADDLIAVLRASKAVVAQSVDNLSAAGLVDVDGVGRVRYREGAKEQAALVKAALGLYAGSPDKVRRLIVAHRTPGVAAFANAFKLRKD